MSLPRDRLPSRCCLNWSAKPMPLWTKSTRQPGRLPTPKARPIFKSAWPTMTPPIALVSRPWRSTTNWLSFSTCCEVPHGWVTGDDELGRHTRFRGALRARGERYVLGVPCTTAVRDLEVPWPAYQGRGRPPKPSWQSVTVWRHALDPAAWTHMTVRDGEKGPVGIEMVTRRVQTRLERKRTGPDEWLVVTRCPLADAGTV